LSSLHAALPIYPRERLSVLRRHTVPREDVDVRVVDLRAPDLHAIAAAERVAAGPLQRLGPIEASFLHPGLQRTEAVVVLAEHARITVLVVRDDAGLESEQRVAYAAEQRAIVQPPADAFFGAQLGKQGEDVDHVAAAARTQDRRVAARIGAAWRLGRAPRLGMRR